MELNLVLRGRAGSTLLMAMLSATREFQLWGDGKHGYELVELKEPDSWNEWSISSSMVKHEIDLHGKPVIAKMPEFEFFLEVFTPLNPRCVILTRSPVEILRSLCAVGWLDRAVERYDAKGVIDRAANRYSALGGQGQTMRFSNKVKTVLVNAWGAWRARAVVEEYGMEAMFVSFDDFMLRPVDIYARLDQFFCFIPGQYWEMWSKMKKKKYQKNGGRTDFAKPYQVPFRAGDRELFAEIENIFQ